MTQSRLKQKQNQKLTLRIAAVGGLSILLIAVVFMVVKLTSVNDVQASTICGSEIESVQTVSIDQSCSGSVEVKEDGMLIIDADVVISGELSIEEGGELLVKDGASLTVGNLKMDDNSSAIEVEAGGWLFTEKAEINKGTFTNNGYVEHTSSSQRFTLKKDMQGTGIFYCTDKTKVKLNGGARLFGKNGGALSDDKFILSSTVITAKRLPKFKVDQDSLELGDSLVVTDTLDLNGKNIDIKTYNFKLPKSFSYHRAGNNSEYIKTGSSGKYKMEILANDREHIAPIGRNPYLPVTAQCEDCLGTEFAVAVTQNVYLDPDAFSGMQSSNAVGETWSVTPNQTFTGSVTFEFQWNAGADGTTNSELTGFNRTSATAYYWIKNQSTQWLTDGVNVDVAVTGTDPYIMSITFNGMTGGKEYLFSVGSAGTALPVEFRYFDAKLIDDKVQLKWGTGTETNNDFFEIQRSTNGINWESLSEVKGAGTTIEEQDYIAYDYKPLNGVAYYRLKQVDFDGAYEYSEMKKVIADHLNSSSVEIMSVFPVPFNDVLNVQFNLPSASDADVQIINSTGTILKNQNGSFIEGENLITFNGLNELEFGTYVIRLVANGKASSKTIVKR